MVESACRPAAAFLAASAGRVCFLMNKYIAFRDRTSVTVQQSLVRRVAVTTAMLMALAMKIVAVHLACRTIAKVVCAAVVFVVWAYPAQRRLVFARPMNAGASMA